MDLPRDDSYLLASFKEAALSVTKLYRAASRDIVRARESGYREAIDDVLSVIASGQDIYEWALARKFAYENDQEEVERKLPAESQQLHPDKRPQQSSPADRENQQSHHLQHQQLPQRAAGMDFAMEGGEFTFRSDLQLDRSYQLPSSMAVQQNTRDYLMIAPEDVLFHAVSAQLEEEQHIANQHQSAQNQELDDQNGMDIQPHQHQNTILINGASGGVKRRTLEFEDATSRGPDFKRYRS
ncbi:uncharacterized protein V2V93DRAFT_374434 [Kockiozyma suomiensis]|uniref:uncharacterized protein n=1 Tax=Kockiozyma suomiensis TaxID=1337062 RepID=UPI003343214C